MHVISSVLTQYIMQKLLVVLIPLDFLLNHLTRKTQSLPAFSFALVSLMLPYAPSSGDETLYIFFS